MATSIPEESSVVDCLLRGLDPVHLTNETLSAAHHWFVRHEVSLPPAASVAEEMANRGLL